MLSALWREASPSLELERALEDFVRRAGAWSELPVTPELLIPWAAERIHAPDPATIDAAPAADIHLAQACFVGDARALHRFEAVLASVRPAIAALGAGANDVDEVLQRLRVQLLVGERPGISAYGGRGDLRSWLRVVAVREGVRLLTARGRNELLDDSKVLELFLPEIDAEGALIRNELRLQFRAAFEDAIRALSARDRIVLRQHAVDDLSIDQIGTLHGVHRATAARWIEQARSALAAGTQEALRGRIGASADEVRDLLKVIMSRMDASVQRLLGV